MKNAIMIRMTKPISIAKLPDKSESDTYYRKLMEQSAKAECQAILDSQKLYGPMTEDQQIDAIAWAYDIKVSRI
jgi:hypothetical protein